MNAAELLAAKQLRTVALPVQVGEGDPVDLQLRALPRKQYRTLCEAHPSETADWNPDTFPPALIAASIVEPVFTVEQATELWEGWEDADAARVFLACFHLNENPAGLSFIWPGSATTSGSGRNSTTAPLKESPTPDS